MENFKALWREQNIVKPDLTELKSRLTAYKKTNIRTLIGLNIVLIATSIFIAFVWYYFEPQLITTKIGSILVIAAMVLYLTVYNKLLLKPNSSNDAKSNSEYLENLVAIKSRQRFLQTTMMNVYYLMLSGGLALYMFEYTSRMSLFYGTVAYGVTFLWIAITWFYLRPRTIRKQQQKVDELIAKFSEISDQLKSTEF